MSENEEPFIAYRIGYPFDMKLVTAPVAREWMNQSNRGFANRCLPMRIAGQAGWVILNDQRVRAKWLGGRGPEALLIEHMGAPPHSAISHFGEGILTFMIPFLFRTPLGTVLLFRGPANMPKDAIAALEAIVETDWAIAPASMNWRFTRADTWVEFAREEPICMIVPQRLGLLESVQPEIRDLKKNTDLKRKFQIWCDNCRNFNERLRNRDSEAVKLGWQRFYFRGTAPHAAETELLADGDRHHTRLNLREFTEHIEADA